MPATLRYFPDLRTLVARSWYGPAAALLIALALAGTSLGAEPAIEQISVGLGNHFKVGCWTPVRIDVAAGDQPLEAELEIVVPDGDGLQARFVAQAGEEAEVLRVPAGQSITVVRLVKIGRIRGRLEARLLVQGEVVATSEARFGEHVTPIYSTQEWIAVIGHEVPLAQAFRRRTQGTHSPVVTVLRDIDRLPTTEWGYDGVDAVMVTTSDTVPIRAMTDDHRQALLAWVRLGGRIVLALGKNGAELGGEQGPLRPLVPMPVQPVDRPLSAPGLESFAHAEQPLPNVAISHIDAGRGQVVAYLDRRTDGQFPAIVRYPLGFGAGTALSFDIDEEPFASWDATATLLAQILHAGEEVSAAGRDSTSRRVTHIGYKEMMGQLRGALDHFPGSESVRGVSLVSFTAVMVIIGVYVLLIGPGDYFLLKSTLRRMEWTWVTFPLVIVLTCLVIHQLGHRWRGGSEPRLRQVDLLDIDLESGLLRGSTWAQLYSPATRSFDLRLQPRWPLTAEQQGRGAVQLAWQGLPGSGLGGFDSTAAEVLTPDPYVMSMNGAGGHVDLRRLPVATGSSKSLFGQWTHYQDLGHTQDLILDRNGFLKGTLSNILNVPLDDAMLAHGQFVYRLDRAWEPGELLRVDGLDRRDLQWRLTRRRIVDSKTSYATTPWDPQSRDVPRIMEIMMLHGAAGGQPYTGLAQKYQAFVDLSQHLELGRAVIIGRIAVPGTDLVDATDQPPVKQIERWAWVRLVVPVHVIETATAEGTLR